MLVQAAHPQTATLPAPFPARYHPSMADASLNPFGTLARHRNFRIFWYGQTLSLVGTWMQGMAQGWLALELTNNAFLVGAVAAAGSLPILLFTLPAGVIVDHERKLRLVILMQVMMLLQATALWLFTLTGHMTPGSLLVLAALGGLCAAIEIPARQALIVHLVSRDDLQGAIALNSSGFNLARIVGPALAAVTIASLGIAWCFGLNALSFVTVIGGLLMIRLPDGVDEGTTREGTRAAALIEGLRYMVGTPAVRALMGLVAIFGIFGGPFLTLMPVVARQQLGLGAGGYGALLASVGVGGVIGALVVAGAGARMPRDRLLFASAMAFCVLLIAFSFTHSLRTAVPILMATGFMMIVVNALANGLLQSIVPDALRGRLMAAYSFLIVGLAQAVGSLGAGAVARAAGTRWAIGGGAAIMLLYTIAARARSPDLTET